MSCCCKVCGPCGSTPCQCGGMEYPGGCGPKPCCKPDRCCRCVPPRGCQRLPRCCVCPPAGFPATPLDCGCPPNGCRSSYPPCPCEPHPCFPVSCRRVRKCAEWPLCPCGRPCYRPLGPPKLCYRPICFPPIPDCPMPRASPLPCWPRLFGGCRYCPPVIRKIYEGELPLLVRDCHCVTPSPCCC